MTQTFGISGGSPLHCTLHHGGVKIYDIITSSRPRSTTTVLRDSAVIASVEWSAISRTKSKVLIEGHTGALDKTLPKAGKLTRSRIYKTMNGKTLKWKVKGSGLACVSPDTGFNLAYHNGVGISAFSASTSLLDVFDEGLDIQDVLVVVTATWVMMEVIVRGRNPATSPGNMIGEGAWEGGSNGGGGYTGGSAGVGDGGSGNGD